MVKHVKHVNVRERVDVKLTTDRDKAVKLFSKPTFKDVIPFTEDFSSEDDEMYAILNTTSSVKNAPVFNHINVNNIHVTLNSRQYPEVPINLNFAQNDFSITYDDAVDFRSKYYNLPHVTNLERNPNISPVDYKSLYPLFVFDVSKQSERLKESMTDIEIHAQLHEPAPENTMAYALLISDKLLSFQSDGNKLNVVQT